MKPLDKAYLIQELSELIEKFNTGHLSYFEHARSKQRIIEIQKICEHRSTKSAYHAHETAIKPLVYAQEFVHKCLYRNFCCGVFQDDQALEKALYSEQDSRWGLLYHAGLGWQIWLLQMPNQTLLISEHDDLETVYSWLLEQQMSYECFTLGTDTQPLEQQETEQAQTPELPVDDAKVEALPSQLAPAQAVDQQATKPTARFSTLPPAAFHHHLAEPQEYNPASTSLRLTRKEECDISQGLEFNLSIEPIQLQEKIQAHTLDTITPLTLEPEENTPKVSVNEAESTAISSGLEMNLHSLHTESHVDTLKQSNKDCLQTTYHDFPQTKIHATPQIHLGEHQVKIINIDDVAAQEKSLYHLQPIHITCQHVDLVLYRQEQENLFTRPVYLAEQIDKQGKFVNYLTLFGVEDNLTALRLAHVYSHSQNYKLAAMSSIDWPNLEQNLFDVETLFNTFHALATPVWSNHRYPFIPSSLIHSQKFIQFDETEADLQTPILLLKERQKIRVIHGENRLNLNLNETAYPYLLLDRQQGVSWQLIQDMIHSLPQPINPIHLYEKIRAYIP